MTISLEEFHQDFFQEVLASADVDGLYAEDAFFELFCDYLAEAGEFDGADRAFYRNPNTGIRVDGYAGDPAHTCPSTSPPGFRMRPRAPNRAAASGSGPSSLICSRARSCARKRGRTQSSSSAG